MFNPVQLTLVILLSSSSKMTSGLPLPVHNSSSTSIPLTTSAKSTTRIRPVSKYTFDSLDTTDSDEVSHTALGFAIACPIVVFVIIVAYTIYLSRQYSKKKAAIEEENFAVNNKNVGADIAHMSDPLMFPVSHSGRDNQKPDAGTIDMPDPLIFPVSHSGRDQTNSSRDSGTGFDSLAPDSISAPPPAYQHEPRTAN
ncbi:unnamed protein product [Ambrosiozyma monospora]|uniref:Unnamed protein product n=1 Tax=Ambrosiozyma monospora TaxID=43982 RepID=A0ACB5TVN5_AMBMO|nr:unnamed protein product [Ambrosiozyma monospora]